MIASLAVGGRLLTGRVIATWYAAVRLPGDARVPLHAGSPEYSVWLSKRTGLAAWLAAGAVVFAALAWLTLSQAAANWAASMRVTLPPGGSRGKRLARGRQLSCSASATMMPAGAIFVS